MILCREKSILGVLGDHGTHHKVMPSMRARQILATALFLTTHWSAVLAQPHHVESRLGEVDFPITCTARAQEDFNHALALLHHMTYPKARAAFEEIATDDSSCAMAYWGVAMTLFQPLWPTRPSPADLDKGRQFIRQAEDIQHSTQREKLFIAAAGDFFRDPEGVDYWERIRRWAEASEAVYRAFPDDLEAAAFYALSLLATAPAGGGTNDHQDRAAEILLAIQAKNPAHPGSLHYLIHANDVHGRENESLDLVRAYDDIAPENPHALHMPTHIFTRLGNWEEVIEGNIRAAAAALENPAGDSGEYVWDEFSHAVEYLVYAYLQQGADSIAAGHVERLKSTQNLHPTFKTAFHLSSIPARYTLERRDWEEAVQLVPRPLIGLDWDRFPWAEAVTWFARGVGAARLGLVEDSRRAERRLVVLDSLAAASGEKLFASQIRILRLEVSAWIANADGAAEKAIQYLQAAAELEGETPKHPVTPAPTLPALEQLGDLLLEQDKPDRALVAYERSLALYPKRFNSLLGAARAANAMGNAEEAGRYYAALVEVSHPRSRRQGAGEARRHVEEPVDFDSGETGSRDVDNHSRR